jgi:uncharacterized membrane protein YccC
MVDEALRAQAKTMNEAHGDIARYWRTRAEKAERDLAEARAKFDRLRDALEAAKNHMHNSFEPDNQSKAYKRVCAILAETET